MAYKNKESSKKWRESHKKELAAYAKKYRDTHPEEVAARAKKHRENNKEKLSAKAKVRRDANKESNKSYQLQHLYNITLEDKQQMIQDQQGLCASCGNILSEGKKIHVDHNHQTGCIRGILCQACNNGLGYFKDDPKLTNAATIYLTKCRP